MTSVSSKFWIRGPLLLAVLFGVSCDGNGGSSTEPDPDPVTIQLLGPTGGETVSGTMTIQWQSQNTTTHTVAIRLSSNSGGSYSETIATGRPPSGSHNWDVSQLSDGSAFRIRVEVLDGSQAVVAWAACASDFAIDNPATVQLLAPVGGEEWEGVQTIQWQSQNAAAETASVLLSDDSGASFGVTLASALGHTDSYDWDVSGVTDGTTYRIQVNLLDASQAVVASDASASDFTIDNPEPRLLLTDIAFADANLRAAVLATGKTYADEVTELSARDMGIVDLSGIEFLTSLASLRLDRNPIVDLTPIADLSGLTTVDLDDCAVTDITPLSGLVNLADLEIARNQVADFSPLATLTDLVELSMGTNPGTDLTPLANLTSLVYLHASYVKPASLAPIGTLTTLEDLSLQGSDLTDINDLAGLVNLTRLSVPNNDLTSLSPVAGMLHLEYLAAYSNDIVSIAPLADLTQLLHLGLSGNPIADFTGLPNLVNLTHLDLTGSNLDDLGLLAGMTGMRELYLGGIGLVDVTPLAQFAELRLLSIWSNSIVDISPLRTLEYLEYLDFRGSNVTDVSSLADLTTLGYLRAKDNAVTTGVAALVTLVNAGTIDLEGNNQIPCADLDALEAALGAGIVKRPAACVGPALPGQPPIRPTAFAGARTDFPQPSSSL